VDHHTRVRGNRSRDAPEQNEGAHRLAICIRQKAGAALIFAARHIDKAADRRRQFELSDLTTQRDRPEYGASIRVHHNCGAAQIMVLRKEQEVARRLRSNGAGRSDKKFAVGTARFGRPLLAQFEAHRQRPVGRAR
jgi:hypothetical protein